MEGEEGGGIRLSKRFSDKGGGEVDYKTKAGTAWSHSYLNQKPWHPLSYPNQRRKWIAEQTHAQRQRRSEEIAREYAQEQEFFRQTAVISKKEKEKVEMMQAVSFMYVRPPGYNAESAKAAELSDERKRQEHHNPSQDQLKDGVSSAVPSVSQSGGHHPVKETKKPRPKDVFGHPLPTEEEFEVLKNAPRMDTGVLARVKPFGVEVRNVKCVRCGNYGHQSGDRECPLKDAIMPNEESRIKREDPLTAILAHTDPSEPLKWELKQKPGMSPPHGGFKPDDPNQQIVAEDIYDEYGGFLGGGDVPEFLVNFSKSKPKKKSSKRSKLREQSSLSGTDPQASDEERLSPSHDERMLNKEKKHERKKRPRSESLSSEDSDFGRHHRRKQKHSSRRLFQVADSDRHHRRKKRRQKQSYSNSSEDSYSDTHEKFGRKTRHHSYSSSSEDSDRHYKSRESRHRHSSDDSDSYRHRESERRRHKHPFSKLSRYSDSEDHCGSKHHRRDKSRRHRH